jgi:enolase-phosphatase E1
LAHQKDPQVKKLLDDVCQETGKYLSVDAKIDQLIRWIDLDKKATPLKSLQGLIWENGYKQGDFCGHVYPDAVENLKRWKACGLDLYVYSSGSVHAQKLLFAHTDYGDLTTLFSGFFDTLLGGKKEQGSYRKIAEIIGCPAEKLLFLSDMKEELDAARSAGFATIWLTRDSSPDPTAEHRQVSSFDQISIDPQINSNGMLAAQ